MINKNIYLFLLLGLMAAIIVVSCKKTDNPDAEPDYGLNIFSVDDDISFGKKLKEEINANPATYPILDATLYPEAYNHLFRIRDSILSSGKLLYPTTFDWEVYIIDDTILNAFAAPGGYMYFYSGLIKYLDNEAQFAGVMAHEMAHVDRRHSSEQLTKNYGFTVLIGIILGDNSNKLAEIAAGMAQGLSALAFSRDNEYEADEFAVKYAYETAYDAKGIKGFFDKLEGHASSTPTFLMTHPSPEDRGEKIVETWTELGAKEGAGFESSYQDFKNSLP